MKTRFGSYSINGISEGCKQCVKGRKLVLFVTGKCTRNCVYCPLSEERKNSNLVFANEKKCRGIKQILEEIKKSKATGAGITGGDPLLKLNKTINFAKQIKKKYPNFHFHIYLSTNLVTKEKLKKLSEFIDEVRFHPNFLSQNESFLEKEIEKIKLASLFYKKQNIGVEIPIFPDKKKQTLTFLKKVIFFVGFINLNELEIGDTNFKFISKNYSLDKNKYTISKSIKIGLEIMNSLKKEKVKIHLCTAETKNWHQYKNRISNYEILKFGKRTKQGTVIYFVVYPKSKKQIAELRKSRFIEDKSKKRFIINPKKIHILIKKFEVFRVEEYPTSDRIEIEKERII